MVFLLTEKALRVAGYTKQNEINITKMNTNENLPDENFTPASCQTNVI
jgi:hypothetical protein